MKPTQIAALVTEGHTLKSRIKADSDRLKAITDSLLELGAGDYRGQGSEKATVICPGPAVKPTSEVIEHLRDNLGEAFGKLFDKAVTWKPAKGFREIANAVLPPAKARKVISQCEQESSPYVRFS